MHINPTVTVRDMPKSEALETHITEKIEKLNQFYPRIMHCDVILEQVQKHKHQGKLYNCRISITVPDTKFAVTHPVNQDAYVAIRDAFLAMRRILQTYNERRRGDIKTHDLPFHGYVARIFPEEGYGFIESNSSEYYFTRKNVTYPEFDNLKIGMLVQFIESMGDMGLQANRVTVGKHQGGMGLVQ